MTPREILVDWGRTTRARGHQDRGVVDLSGDCLNWPELKGAHRQVLGFGRVKRPLAESAYRVEKEKISGNNRRILW